MSNVRLIARLDIKGPNLIKGIQLEGLRVLGDPNDFARRYYEDGVDEILYMDVVASLYGRDNLVKVISHTTQAVFIPLTAGGGVRSIDDVKELLRAGADKVAINTAAVKDPGLITRVAHRFGSQCMVLSIEAKRVGPGKWEAYTDNGRERTELDAVQWAQQAVELGAGEILLTSVDQEGTRKGFDVELVRAVSEIVDVPVIASGGMGSIQHLLDVVKVGKADAVAMADIIHYRRQTLLQIRDAALAAGLSVREL
jgi:cyclase